MQHSASFNEDEMAGPAPYTPKKLGCLARCLYKLDHHILKPILVYKYTPQKIKEDNQFFEDFESHADEIRDKVLSQRDSDSV